MAAQQDWDENAWQLLVAFWGFLSSFWWGSSNDKETVMMPKMWIPKNPRLLFSHLVKKFCRIYFLLIGDKMDIIGDFDGAGVTKWCKYWGSQGLQKGSLTSLLSTQKSVLLGSPKDSPTVLLSAKNQHYQKGLFNCTSIGKTWVIDFTSYGKY